MITELKISPEDIDLIKSELESNNPYEACGGSSRQTARQDFHDGAGFIKMAYDKYHEINIWRT